MIHTIVQARMGSTRLPGKSLRLINGKPALQHVIQRISTCHNVDRVIIATSTSEADNAIALFCSDFEIPCYRGSEDDVLDRYYQCAKRFGAKVIVRITGDCPLIDPDVVDACVELYLSTPGGDVYASNCVERTYPDGLDVEVFSYRMLEEAWLNAEYASEREHVTPYIRKHNPHVDLKLLEEDLSSIRLTLDYVEDYIVIEALMKALSPGDEMFSYIDAVNWLIAHPEYIEMNGRYEVNEGLAKSLQEDRKVSRQ